MGADRPAQRPSGRRDEARARLVGQITACWRTQALNAAVLLDLPDRLASGWIDPETLARACDVDPDGLRRLLQALCVLQVCRQGRHRHEGRYRLTCAGQALCRAPADGSPSLRAMAMWWGGPLWPMWGELGYSVRSGRSARARLTGRSHYGFLDGQPAAATLFHAAMQALTTLVAGEVARLPLWQGAGTLVDVGGGIGTLGAAIAVAHPGLQLVVLDRADAAPGAQALFEQHALAERARFEIGDFFAAVPPGADRYLLKSILHNWDDDACRRLLARCAEAAPAGARLVVVERVRGERLGATPHDEALVRTDLNMLAGLGGRERGLAEFRDLLEAAGFEPVAVTPTRHEFSVIEARRRQPRGRRPIR
ncbi:methyltransferase [Leptothrix sp. BB-4]